MKSNFVNDPLKGNKMTKKATKTISLTSFFLTVLSIDGMAMELGQPISFEKEVLSSRSLLSLYQQENDDKDAKEIELKKNIWDGLGIWLKPKRAGEIRLNNLKDYSVDLTNKSYETKKLFFQEGTLSLNDLSRLTYLKSVMVAGIQVSTPTVWSRRQQGWKNFSEKDKKKASKIIHHIDQLLKMNQSHIPLLDSSYEMASFLNSIHEDSETVVAKIKRLTPDHPSLSLIETLLIDPCWQLEKPQWIYTTTHSLLHVLSTLQDILADLGQQDDILNREDLFLPLNSVRQKIDRAIQVILKLNSSDYVQSFDSIFNRKDMLMIRLLLAGSYEIHHEEVSGGIQKRILKISEMLKKLVGENQVSHKGNPDIVYLPYLSTDHRVREAVHGIFELSQSVHLTNLDIKYILCHLQDLENSITSYNVNQAKSGFLKKISTFMVSLSSQEVLQIIGSCVEEVDSIKRLGIEILIRQDRDFIEYHSRMAQMLENTYKKRLETYADKTEINILSVDGGGIRGLIPASLIKIIEAETGKPITELFDFFAGTSTGGIITVGLTTPTYVGGELPKYAPSDILNLYTTKGEQIFPPLSSTMKKILQVVDTAYDSQVIEGLYATYFSHYPLSAAVKPTIVIVGDLTRGQKTILSSVKAIENPESDILMRHAVRATSAAPTYLSPLTVWHEEGIKEYVDGGIMANNPVKEALDEARKCYPKATTINIISFGTGTSPYGYAYGHTNVGLVGGALQSFKLVKRDNARSAEKELKESYIPLLEQTGKHITFRRINPEIATKISLDEASPENIQQLELAAKQAASCPEFKELIEFLKMQAK